MRATRPLAAGEEVLHSYGAHGSMARVAWLATLTLRVRVRVRVRVKG